MSWNAHALALGSRDIFILMQDVRAPEPYTYKLMGNRQEVGVNLIEMGHRQEVGVDLIEMGHRQAVGFDLIELLGIDLFD